MAGPKSRLEAARFVKKVYISKAKIAEENNRTMNFGEKGLLICGHIYLGKQLQLQISDCCLEVLQNKEMTSPWSNHCWMLVAELKMVKAPAKSL